MFLLSSLLFVRELEDSGAAGNFVEAEFFAVLTQEVEKVTAFFHATLDGLCARAALLYGART